MFFFSFDKKLGSSGNLPAVEKATEQSAPRAPQSSAHWITRVTRVVSNTVEYSRRFRSLSQPISDNYCVTWCQPTVGVADNKNVDVGIVDYSESPHHRCQLLADVTYLSTQLKQPPQHAVKVIKTERKIVRNSHVRRQQQNYYTHEYGTTPAHRRLTISFPIFSSLVPPFPIRLPVSSKSVQFPRRYVRKCPMQTHITISASRRQ